MKHFKLPFRRPGLPVLAIAGLLACLVSSSDAQGVDPKVTGYADKILGRTNTDPAVIDRNSDGRVDVRDLVLYINGLPLTAWFTAPESSALTYGTSPIVEVQFTRPVNGVFAYNFGGTAVTNRDYAALSGQISVTNSYRATIPVPLQPSTTLRAPRSIVLSLKSPATNVASRIAAAPSEVNTNQSRYSSHVITLRDADQGLYQGNLSFLSQTTRLITNGVTNVTIIPAPAVAPSTFIMGLRSGASPQAVMEMPEFVLLTTNRVTMPVTLGTNLGGFTAAVPLAGSSTLAQLGKTVSWTMEFTSFNFTNSAVSFAADCRFTVNGLTASGTPLILNGTLNATRLDP